MDRELDDVRERLTGVADPVALLVGIFAHAPVGLQIYRADGRCILTNRAFRRIFGAEPPPEYNVLEDPQLAQGGVLELTRRAFAGESFTTPPTWYDARQEPSAWLGSPVGRVAQPAASMARATKASLAAHDVEHLVPVFQPVLVDDAMHEERVAAHEFFRGLAGGENAERPGRRIAVRAGHQQHATRMEFLEACDMRRIVGRRLGQALRRHLVEHQDFHGNP